MKRYSFAAFLSSALLMVLLTACGGTVSPSAGSSHAPMSGMNRIPAITSGSDPLTDSLKGLSGMSFEVTFMQDMIVHHQFAMYMAMLVPTHTKRLELTTFSQNSITTQNEEIATMTTWLGWYNEKPLEDAISVPGMINMMADMDTLKQENAAAFDQHFLLMMIAHHQQAINMANLIPLKTQRPELVQLGQHMVKTQLAEIKQMQDWQQQWFKR